MNTDIRIAHPTDRPNFSRVFLGGGVSLTFSYETVIGVSGPEGTVTRQNYWGPTTGKHLNNTPGPRVDDEEFDRVLSANLAHAGRILAGAS